MEERAEGRPEVLHFFLSDLVADAAAAAFSEEERRVVLEFVEYRASLPDHIYDEPYLEVARSFWRER